MKTSEILIIGTGVVGTPLANYLNKHFQVRTISRSYQPPSLRKHKIPHKICDITNFNKLKRVIGNPFLIIHTAMASIPEINENKETGYEVNVGGTQNICKLVSQNPNISALIFLSTMRVFGERDYCDLINEESTLKPNANRKLSRPYILSKIAGESIVKLFDERLDGDKLELKLIKALTDKDGNQKFAPQGSYVEKNEKYENLMRIHWLGSTGMKWLALFLGLVATVIGIVAAVA